MDVFVDAADLCLLLSQEREEQARTKLWAGSILKIKSEYLKVPVLLRDFSTMKWGQLENINIQPLTYQQACRFLKRLANHPLACFSGLLFYNLQRMFATSLMHKIPREQLNLLMGHCRPLARHAATTYQLDFAPVNISAILTGALVDDPLAHAGAQQASGHCHGQGPQAVFSQLAAYPEVAAKAKALYELRQQLLAQVEHQPLFFVNQAHVDEQERDSETALKLEIAEAKIDILAFVCNLLGGMGVDMEAMADVNEQPGVPSSLLLPLEPSGSATAASLTAGPSSAALEGNGNDADDPLTLDEYMQLFQDVVNQGLSPLCGLSFSQTVALVGQWLAKAKTIKQQFCTDCFDQASQLGIAVNVATREQLATFCQSKNIHYSDQNISQAQEAVRLYRNGSNRMLLIDLDRPGLVKLAHHLSLFNLLKQNAVGRRRTQEAALDFLSMYVDMYVPADFAIPTLAQKAKCKKAKGKGQEGKRSKQKRASTSKAAQTTIDSTSSSGLARTASSTDPTLYGKNKGTVHVPMGPSLHPPDILVIGSWHLLPKEFNRLKRIYSNLALWSHLQQSHLPPGWQWCWYCLELFESLDAAHTVSCQESFFLNKHDGIKAVVVAKDTAIQPSLCHLVQAAQFSVFVSMCQSMNTLGLEVKLVPQRMLNAMQSSSGPNQAKQWIVDSNNKIGCPVVFCTTNKAEVREMLCHIANVHWLSLVYRYDKWAHDFTEEEMKSIIPFKLKKDWQNLLCFSQQVPSVL